VGLILTEFFAHLTEEEQLYMWLQQDSATSHTTDDSLVALEEVFGDKIISHGLWPAYSPDLTPCDFYLRSDLKDGVYVMNPYTEEELKENLEREILEVSLEELQVNSNLFKQYRECVHVQGHHFQHLYLTHIRKVLQCLAVSHAVPARKR
jgi:hypothetical protein